MIRVSVSDGDPDVLVARDGDEVVGVLRTLRDPSGRLRLYFGPTRDDAHEPLLAAVDGECRVTVPADDDRFAPFGFTVDRRDHLWTIPVARHAFPVPDGIRLISAADAEPALLLDLDSTLRDDVPGSAGWRPDPAWFRALTYDSPEFDPATYLVAVAGDGYAGLVRIWCGPRPTPRLGLIGVCRQHRRRGLARALIAAAMASLVDRAVAEVTAESDVTNRASFALLSGFGGRVTGGEWELVRH